MEKGHKRVDVVKVELVREKTIRYGSAENRRIDSPKVAAELIHSFIGNSDREHFGIIAVNTKHEPTHLSVISIGSINACIVHPREVFKAAILSNAAKLFLFHNHPTGDTTPSSEDKEVTKKLKSAGDLLSIKVLDHIIIGADPEDYFSFNEEGLLSLN